MPPVKLTYEITDENAKSSVFTLRLPEGTNLPTITVWAVTFAELLDAVIRGFISDIKVHVSENPSVLIRDVPLSGSDVEQKLEVLEEEFRSVTTLIPTAGEWETDLDGRILNAGAIPELAALIAVYTDGLFAADAVITPVAASGAPIPFAPVLYEAYVPLGKK